jgi:hypothetical protein
LDDAANLFIATNDRIDLAGSSVGGEISSILLECLEGLLRVFTRHPVITPNLLQGTSHLISGDPKDGRKLQQKVFDREVGVSHLLAGLVGCLEGCNDGRRELCLTSIGLGQFLDRL